jgi:hypothetical protein
MEDPFAHLNYEQIQIAVRKAKIAHPVMWRVAEFVVFVRGSSKWVRSWLTRRALNRIEMLGRL